LYASPTTALAAENGHHNNHTAFSPPPVAALPFATLLGGIALFPLLKRTAHAWESNRTKFVFAVGCALPVVLLLMSGSHWHLLLEIGIEYAQFVCLLAALFIVCGGIHIRGSFRPTPMVNTCLMAVGYLLASVVGTMGASMLLAFPLLRSNAGRKHQKHLWLFFILSVSNAGGMLTPLGDPPLFLGYLRGIPFGWWAGQLTPIWLITGCYLLTVFFCLDAWMHRKEEVVSGKEETEKFGLLGSWNVVLLGGILAATIALSSPWREMVYLSLAGLSLVYSQRTDVAKDARERNGFSWNPILEVLILFFGIFSTMVAPIALLKANGEALGITEPWQYFLGSGAFSSVLDNAPTFVIFGETAVAQSHLSSFSELTMIPRILAAISAGAVLMGANTYVGNAPNFVVKSLVEGRGVRMPNFFTYAGMAMVIMTPIYVMIALIL
jgi:Na+/H+ antiporter NhaD/arsenite permease-like protein